MRTALKIGAVLLGIVVLVGAAHMAILLMPSGYGTISNAELEARLAADETITVVDVRDADDFAQGHIDGALSIPSGELRARIAEVPEGATVAVTCYRGLLNRSASRKLHAAGYDVLRVEGGMSGWTGSLVR